MERIPQVKSATDPSRRDQFLGAAIIGLLPVVFCLIEILRLSRSMVFLDMREILCENLWRHAGWWFLGTVLSGVGSAILFFRCRIWLARAAGILAIFLNIALLWFIFVLPFWGGH